MKAESLQCVNTYYKIITRVIWYNILLIQKSKTSSELVPLYDITIEGYLAAGRDQEIPTKFMKHKRQIDAAITPSGNKKCRLCKSNVEAVNYIISSCNEMSARHYLPLRHDVIVSTVLKMIMMKNHQERNVKLLNVPEYIIKMTIMSIGGTCPSKQQQKFLITNEICLYGLLIKRYVRL